MLIRRASPEDAVAIATVHVKSWKETYSGVISHDFLDSLKIEERLLIWEKILSQPADITPVFVAVNSNNEIIGFASFGRERTKKSTADSELYAIYILDQYKRRKAGLELLLSGVNELLLQKYNSMLVWVLEENSSRGFYESLHPRKEGEEIDKIGEKKYVEIAYVWDDLNLLQESIADKLKI